MCNALINDSGLGCYRCEFLDKIVGVIDAEKYLKNASCNMVQGLKSFNRATPQPQMKDSVFEFFMKKFVDTDGEENTCGTKMMQHRELFSFGFKHIVRLGDEELLIKIATKLLSTQQFPLLKIFCQNGEFFIVVMFFFFADLLFSSLAAFSSHKLNSRILEYLSSQKLIGLAWINGFGNFLFFLHCFSL